MECEETYQETTPRGMESSQDWGGGREGRKEEKEKEGKERKGREGRVFQVNLNVLKCTLIEQRINILKCEETIKKRFRGVWSHHKAGKERRKKKRKREGRKEEKKGKEGKKRRKEKGGREGRVFQ